MRPDLETVAEAGYPELTFNGLGGWFGPKGMSLQLRERIAGDVRDAAADPAFERTLTTFGTLKMIGGAADFTKSIDEQRAVVATAAKSINVAPKR
jgi:tripartite-type tricarboxylate transporter receptor subunit TctC